MNYITKDKFKNTLLEPLLNIHKCPKGVYYKGEINALHGYLKICIVGSRIHSSYAKEVLKYLISKLSGRPVVVVSGLALGIDGLAHRIALENGVKTVAVVGSSLEKENIYPRSNFGLANEIIENNGLLLSEYKNTKAQKWTFPQRNRIMAGMSDLILVIEASERSGTLITAHLGMEYGVDVAVIPGGFFSEFSRGSNALIKDGAHLVGSVDDLFELLNLQSGNLTEKKDFQDISSEEKDILSKLKEPLSRSDLKKVVEIDDAELSKNLSLLEIKGYITESLGLIRRVD